MGRYLGAYTPADTNIYPPFINFTDLGGGKVRIIVRSDAVLTRIPGRGEELFRDSGSTATFDIEVDELKQLLTEVLGKLNDD